MDKISSMRVFIAVADAEGFAPAARQLGLSPPAVTRAIAALEERIGTRLLHRTTRLVRLTEAGARFLVDARRILAEIEEAEAAAAGDHARPRGLLTVTAPVLFGRMHVAPVVLDFLELHPEVSIRLLLLDRVTDLLDEGIDVALRIAHLPDSSLNAVRVGSVRRVTCAAPGYLARRGTPLTPADLAGHDTIGFGIPHTERDWVFGSGPKLQRVKPASRLLVNTADVAIAAAVAGRGITRVLSYQIASELSCKRLQLLLEKFDEPPVPIHLVHAEGRRPSAKLRVFIDFAAGRLRQLALT